MKEKKLDKDQPSASVKKKVKPVVEKKPKAAVIKKTKAVVAKKAKPSAEKTSKPVAEKKTKIAAEKKSKPVVEKKIESNPSETIKSNTPTKEVDRHDSTEDESPRRKESLKHTEEKKPYWLKPARDSRSERSFEKKPSRNYKGEKKEYKPFNKEERKPFKSNEHSAKDENSRDKKPYDKNYKEKKPFKKGERKTYQTNEWASGVSKRRNQEPNIKNYKGKKPFNEETGRYDKKAGAYDGEDELIRLNRYIANAGVCGRREADLLIKAGEITVNDILVKEVGTKVKRSDKVTYQGNLIQSEKPVYLLLNKPKGFITTMKDPKQRRTVVELVQSAGKERVYPVGRLDMDTTGLLLMTNDGDLTKRLTHPSHEVHKIYHVTAHREISDEDIEKISKGLTLEDGFIKPDSVSRIVKAELNEIGIELHSGKNRIVRRILEHLDYRVIKLDRVVFGNLTKKDLPRGRWRRLNDWELGLLKRIAGKKDEPKT